MTQALATQLTTVYKAQSIIERDSLMAELSAAGIEAETEKKTMHNRIGDTTVDLAYDGVSSVSFDGYKIEVSNADSVRARAVIEQALERFKREEKLNKPEMTGDEHVRRYVASGLFGMFVPVIFLVLGGYHLVQAVKLRGNVLKPMVLVATGLHAFMAGLTIWFIGSFL